MDKINVSRPKRRYGPEDIVQLLVVKQGGGPCPAIDGWQLFPGWESVKLSYL